MTQKNKSVSGSLLVCVCSTMQAGKACVGFSFLLGEDMTTAATKCDVLGPDSTPSTIFHIFNIYFSISVLFG